MKISFPSVAPEYHAPDLVLAFPALVEGGRVQCAITAAALEDHFGAASPCERDLADAFARHRQTIECTARRVLEEVGGHPILLRSGLFRFCL